ncbi:hypothetical protein ACFFUR_03080, partial [Echinicola jeungdonensis]
DNSTFTAVYALTQADIDAGTFTNTAEVSGDTPADNAVTDSDDDTQTFTEAASISLVKTGTYVDSNGDGEANVGDEITYSFTIENTGNVTLDGIMVTDPQVTVSGSAITLAPGATDNSTFTAVYALTQPDIDAGTFTNTAEVNGVTPADAPVTDSDDDTQTFAEAASISLEKAGTYVDNNGDGVANVGDEITYSFTIENTGNVTLDGIMVTDPQVTVSGSAITLAPGATDNSTFTAVYALTQADIDAGTFTNTAEVSGDTPADNAVTDSDDDTQTFTEAASISLVKTGTYVDS